MKICPKCQNKYTDLTLNFCLQDGTQLIERVREIDQSPTVAFDQSETETVISKRSAEQIQFDLRSKNEEQHWEESQATGVSAVQTEPKSSKTLLTILLTALVMFTIFGIVGVGAYIYYNSDKKEVAENKSASNTDNLNTENSKDNSTVNNSSSKTPIPTPKKTPEKTPEPTPDTDPAETKKEIESRIYTWKSLAESQNLESYMDNYDSIIDYYNKKSASKSFVRSDKQNAFSKYTSIKSTISNMNITPSSDGKTAVATFDKEWIFSSQTEQNSGKVQTQLKLKKSVDKWLITSEKDLKVYYVNK